MMLPKPPGHVIPSASPKLTVSATGSTSVNSIISIAPDWSETFSVYEPLVSPPIESTSAPISPVDHSNNRGGESVVTSTVINPSIAPKQVGLTAILSIKLMVAPCDKSRSRVLKQPSESCIKVL